MTRTTPPVWFWVAAVLLALWGVVGVVGFAFDPVFHPATLAQMTDYDRQIYAARPAWTVAAYAVGTITGLVGSLALLLRRRDAIGWYVVSLIAVVVLFGYMLGATSLIAVKGLAGAALFPLVIFVLCLVEIALARHARRRGWIA